MGKTDNPTFAEIIEQAQKTPERSRTRGSELSSPFGVALPPDHRVVDDDPRQINGVPQYDYEVHVEFLVLPKDTDGYTRILNEAASGKCVIRSEDKTFTKEGEFIVVVQYMTKLERPRRANRRREEDDFGH